MIVFKNVTFQYRGGACGAAGLDLAIPDGAFVVLAGDSGCGKTTVTRLVNGLAPHYFEGELAGEVLVNGIDTRRGIGALAAHVGSVFQNPKSQFFNVDAVSELAFAPENLGLPPEKIRADMERVVREMRLAPLMDRSIFALSGGEKQQIACGAVAGPDGTKCGMKEGVNMKELPENIGLAVREIKSAIVRRKVALPRTPTPRCFRSTSA